MYFFRGETEEAKPNQINITEVESKVVEDKKSLIGHKYTLAEVCIIGQDKKNLL